MVAKHGKSILNKGYLYKKRVIIYILKILDFILSFFFIKKKPLPEKIKNILIVKPDHYGDALMLTSILPVIKKDSSVNIDIICNNWSLAVFENNPYVRNKFIVNHFMYNREKKFIIIKIIEFLISYLKAIKEIRQQSYDICLIMRAYGGNLISLARLGKIKFIIGHKTGGLGPLLDKVVVWQEGLHEIEHYLEVLKPLDIDANVNSLKYELYPSDVDEDYVNSIINKFNLDKFIVIHPGSGDKRKQLNSKIWCKIMNRINEDIEFVFTGLPEDRLIFEEISNMTKKKILCLMGFFTIKQLYLFLKRSISIFTVDSLAAHVASMTDKPVFVFFSGIADIEQWRPMGKKVKIISKEIKCVPCYKGCQTMDCLNFKMSEIPFD